MGSPKTLFPQVISRDHVTDLLFPLKLSILTLLKFSVLRLNSLTEFFYVYLLVCVHACACLAWSFSILVFETGSLTKTVHHRYS